MEYVLIRRDRGRFRVGVRDRGVVALGKKTGQRTSRQRQDKNIHQPRQRHAFKTDENAGRGRKPARHTDRGTNRERETQHVS